MVARNTMYDHGCEVRLHSIIVGARSSEDREKESLSRRRRKTRGASTGKRQRNNFPVFRASSFVQAGRGTPLRFARIRPAKITTPRHPCRRASKPSPQQLCFVRLSSDADETANEEHPLEVPANGKPTIGVASSHLG